VVKNTKEKEIRKFLKELDTISKQISENNISEKIKIFIKNNFNKNTPDILMWEQMAFDFIENYIDNKSGWGTYFGPMLVMPNKEGKMIEYPSIQKVTPDIISYWEKRSKESGNPILRARYSSLVLDFSERVKGEKPHYTIAQIFIDSVVEIAEKDLHKNSVDVIKKLGRALSVALSINDRQRVNKVVDTIIAYEKRIVEDNRPSLVGFSFELLVKNKKVSLSKEKKHIILNNLERKFNCLTKGKDHLGAKRIADLLVDYYFKIGDRKKAKEILLKFGEMVQRQAKQISPILAGIWLEELYHLYLQYGLKSEAGKILNEIREVGRIAKSDLKEFKASVEIPKDDFEKYIERLTDGELDAVLRKIAVSYIPRKDEVIKLLQRLSEEAPLSYRITRKIIDVEGRPIATVGSLEDDIDGHIILQISQNMEISSFFLRETLNVLIDKFSLTAFKIVNYLYKSPIFDERRKEFFIKGIETFLNKDFLISLHILIPQIEAVIRNLAEKIGVAILKSSRFGGFFYRTLDDLLREERIIKVLSEDICLYFRVLLTDPRGWNIRNYVCHGISRLEDFNQIVADRIFHVLLCLALIKER